MPSDAPVQQQQQQQHEAAEGDGDMTSLQNVVDCHLAADGVDVGVMRSPRVLQYRQWVAARQQHGRELYGVPVNSSTSLISSSISSKRESSAVMRFRIATYNILSDRCIRPGEYLYCPAQLRYMSSRHERIITEVNSMQPHVVCLQVFLSVFLSPCVCVGGGGVVGGCV